MSKNLKKIIALALVLGTVSAVTPATNINLLTQKVYATNSSADELDKLELQDDDGDDIDLYKDKDYDDDIDSDEVKEGKTYYAKSDSGKVKIDIDGADNDKVRIFKGTSDKAYEVGDDISLPDGSTSLYIKVYEDDYDSSKSYSSSDYNEYKIKVENDEDDDNEDDELEKLELRDDDGDDIKLYEDSDYDDKIDSDEISDDDTYYAKTSSKEVFVDVDGPDDKYVKIFKSTSDSEKGIDPGDTFSVSSDKTITVRVYGNEPDSDITYEDDSDVTSEYVIELEYTGKSSEANTSSSKNNNSTKDVAIATTKPDTATVVTPAVKANQWVQVNGRWQYYDSTGTLLRNAWCLDRNDQRWYYLGSDGNMVVNTVINGYRVGSDGAWIQ